MRNIRVLLVLIIFWMSLCFNIEIVQGIIGGQDVTTKHFRYQVSLQTNNEHICGGVIINEEHVLTAANCLIDSEEQFINRKYVVVAGINNLKGEEPDRVEIDVEKIFVPTEFKRRNTFKNPTSSQNRYYPVADLAVLKLERNLFEMNPSLISVKLPTNNWNNCPTFEGSRTMISGFGIENLNSRADPKGYGQYSSKLKFGTTYILNQGLCSQKLNFKLDDRHLCTEMTHNVHLKSEGVCDGDVGGPIILQGKLLIGILSQHATDCNDKSSPALCTRIPNFMPFINDAVHNEFKDGMRMAYYKNKIFEENENVQKELVEMYHFI